MKPAFSLCPCTVRRSPRARHVRLVVTAEGLTVVVPQRCCVSRDVEPLLLEKKDWIAKALEKISARVRMKEETKGLPQTIDLRATEECWQVNVAPLAGERLVAEGRTLTLTSDFNEKEALAALRRWLLLKAQACLPPLLRETAERHGLRVGNVSVREQKSLWGSCSAKGNVSLNSRLLFLPPRLVLHVLLHELCHLKVMNHSQDFYDLLKKLDPDAREHARTLKQAWSWVPGWAL